VLCGGLASGKSAVGAILGDRPGILAIDADEVGHQVLEPDGPAFSEVAAAWPQVVSEGRIQRASLAAIVFARDAELKKLESITHPHIFGTITRRVEDFDGVVVVEAPILHHGLGPGWGRIVVDAEDEARLDRAVARGLTREEAKSRMAVQPTREEWLSHTDVVIPNHGTIGELEATVERLVPLL